MLLIGPGPTVVVASIALLLQALFLAHGGLTTLGANIMSMGVVGAFSAYGIYHLLRWMRRAAAACRFFGRHALGLGHLFHDLAGTRLRAAPRRPDVDHVRRHRCRVQLDTNPHRHHRGRGDGFGLSFRVGATSRVASIGAVAGAAGERKYEISIALDWRDPCSRLITVAAIFGTGWKGVDESVIEKVAHDAGREPQRPLIDVEKGDLQLFAFLTAGAVGGFVLGYSFRSLFPPKGEATKDHAPNP